MAGVQALLAVGHAAVLLCTDWQPLCRKMPVVGGWPVIGGVLALMPFLVSVVLAWMVTYPADRAVRQVALELYLIRGKPLRPVWASGQYVLYNLRSGALHPHSDVADSGGTGRGRVVRGRHPADAPEYARIC
jgi:hypothetical protein